MQSSYPQNAGKRFLTLVGAAALGVAAFASPAAAQTPVPTDAAVDIPSPLWADDTSNAASIGIEFGDDFVPADHEVSAVLAFDSDRIWVSAGTTDDGFCGPDATTGDLSCLSESTDGSIHWEFEVAAEWGTPEGEYPYELVVTVDDETVETVEGSIDILAGDTGNSRPYLHGDAVFDGVEPGSAVAVKPQFLQDTAIADGAVAVVVTAWAPEYLPHGLARPGAGYDNCLVEDGVNVTCVVTDFEDLPGTVFTFADQIDYTVDENAPGPIDVCDCVYEVRTIADDELEGEFGGVFWDEGSDNLFGLEVAAEPIDEFGDEFQGRIDIITAANPFDLAVADANAKGDNGDQVTLTVPVKNLGPANASSFFDGPGSYGIIGSLPKGLELVKIDSDGDTVFCFEPDDPQVENSFPQVDPAKTDFVCIFSGIDADASIDFKFTVKITDANANAKGTLEVAAIDNDGYPGVADADAKNNIADITVNGTGSGTGSGQLPKTGTSLTVIVGIAALVLVAGAVMLVVTARKRRA